MPLEVYFNVSLTGDLKKNCQLIILTGANTWKQNKIEASPDLLKSKTCNFELKVFSYKTQITKMITAPSRVGPQASGWTALDKEKDTTLMAIRVGVNMLQFSSISNSLSTTQTLQIKWKVYYFKEVFARLYYCAIMILHVYVLCVCIVNHGHVYCVTIQQLVDTHTPVKEYQQKLI